MARQARRTDRKEGRSRRRAHLVSDKPTPGSADSAVSSCAGALRVTTVPLDANTRDQPPSSVAAAPGALGSKGAARSSATITPSTRCLACVIGGGVWGRVGLGKEAPVRCAATIVRLSVPGACKTRVRRTHLFVAPWQNALDAREWDERLDELTPQRLSVRGHWRQLGPGSGGGA